MSETPVLRRILGNAGALLGGRTINAVLGLAYMAVTARALGASSLGVLVLINAFAQVLGDVAKFQSWQTVLQYGAKPLAEGDRPGFQQVVRFTLLLDGLGAVIGVTLGIGGALLFGDKLGWSRDMAPAAALYALSVAFMAPATSLGLLRLFDRFRPLAAQQAVSSMVRLVGGALAWTLAWPIEAFLVIWAAGTLASFAYLAGASCIELHRRRLLDGFTWRGPLSAGLPGVWRFAWATNFSSTLDVAFTHVITLVVGALMGPAPAALWRVGRQVADGLAKPARLLIPALYPELAKLRAADGEAAMNRLARQVGLLGGAAAGVLLLVTALVGKPLLVLVMGQAFAPASGIMTWQVAAAAIGVLSLPVEPMLVSLGRAGAALRVRLVVCVVYLIALAPVIKAFGLTGAGAALVGAMAAMALGMFWRLRAGALPITARDPRQNSCVDSENNAKGGM